MARSRRNPIGRPADVKAWGGNAILVRSGQGKMTHVYQPGSGEILCQSGKNVGSGKQDFYLSKAHYITCYRCAKLATMNAQEGRAPWDSGR